MMISYRQIRQRGFSLVEVMIALALVGGIALLIMNLGKQGSNIQVSSMATNDETELLSIIRTVLSKPQNCVESLKTVPGGVPITFRKIDVDKPNEDEGYETEIWQKAFDGSKKKILSGDNDRFGKLRITSIKLVMNNGTGFNYPANPSHTDTGIIRISYEKPMGDNFVTKISDITVSVLMSTAASGITTALGCSKDSSLEVIKQATVSGMSLSGYVHNWDQIANYTCPGQKALCGETSYHNNDKEDRRHSFKCCDIRVDNQVVNRKSCTWQGQLNNYDGILNFTCPNNTIATGHWSKHDNGTEDRIYDFYCCEYGSASQKIQLSECSTLPSGGWLNNWDAPVNFTCPANTIKVGEVSVHHNSYEDRIYRFKCCKVLSEEKQ